MENIIIADIVKKLFFGFMKEHKLFHRIYNSAFLTKFDALFSQKHIRAADISQLFIIFGTKMPCLKEDFALSQLWRFYVLDNITLFHDLEESLQNSIIRDLKSNGYRNNKKIKELFDKHKLKPNIY